MTKSDIMAEVEIALEESKTAVLATVDDSGRPRVRWMTPAVLKDRPNVLYSITSSGFEKAKHLDKNAEAEWMIQTPALDTVINLRGKINLIDNPSLKTEVLESIGKKLTAFWKLNEQQENLLVLETIIEEGTFFKPMRGVKSKVRFS
jgi:general stress protein 26